MRRFALVAHGGSRPSGRIRSFMQKSGSRISPDTPPAATRGSVRSLRGLFVPRSGKIASAKAQAEKNASGCPPARHTRLVCDCSSLSPLTLKPLRSPTPCPFTAIATALLSGYAAHAAARSMVTATVASGLGFSVASLPQCRRGAFSASIRAVRRLPQGRYAVGCAASGKKKRRGFASVSAACFLSSCAGGGKVGGCW